MAIVYEGNLVGTGLKFGIVAARWNDFMGGKLLDGAKDALLRHGVADEHIAVALVPGSFELPLVARRMADSGKYDAVICPGVMNAAAARRGTRARRQPWPRSKWRTL